MTDPTPTPLVAMLPVDEISPHPANPKAHDLDGLVRSIARLGFAEPSVVDQRTGLNVSGHGRVEALQVLRSRILEGVTDDKGEPYDVPPGISVTEDDRWLAPVFTGWRSRDDREAEAALVALNRIGERGGWHDAPLLSVLERLADLDAGLDGIGYDDRELDQLRDKLAEPAPPEVFPDPNLETDHECPACGYRWSQ
jgi:hypothetical protein